MNMNKIYFTELLDKRFEPFKENNFNKIIITTNEAEAVKALAGE